MATATTTPSAKPVATATTGRRKTAVARIQIATGTGKIRVNGRAFDDYFPTVSQQNTVLKPFEAINGVKNYDVEAKTSGGGLQGQAGALSLAIARALNEFNEANRPALKADGLLTRDPRMRERKKPGRPGARKRFQFSKR